MNKKYIKLIIAGVLTIASFSALIFINKSMTTRSTESVYVLNVDKSKGDVISESDLELEDIDTNSILDGAIKQNQLDEIEGKHASTDMFKKEQVVKERLFNEINLDSSIERELTIKFDKLEGANGGTLKKGDMIDIIVTDKVGTRTLGQNLKVYETLDSNGKVITNGIAATMLKLRLDPYVAHKIEDGQENGTLAAMKVTDENIYQEIQINNNNIVDSSSNTDK